MIGTNGHDVCIRIDFRKIRAALFHNSPQIPGTLEPLASKAFLAAGLIGPHPRLSLLLPEAKLTLGSRSHHALERDRRIDLTKKTAAA
jgi:hypothetical protein